MVDAAFDNRVCEASVITLPAGGGRSGSNARRRRRGLPVIRGTAFRIPERPWDGRVLLTPGPAAGASAARPWPAADGRPAG